MFIVDKAFKSYIKTLYFHHIFKRSKHIVDLTQERRREIECKWKDYISMPGPVNSTGEYKSKYILPMFPYPSGHLHMGHARVYTISDVWTRYHRMAGYDVIHPIGWDAFGLPAENAAISKNISPAKWTADNISSMKKQIQDLACNFDWSREISTCDPSYYKWTQYIFLKLFHAGLAYRRKAGVNWDPVDRTVLANEQVDDEGRSWRSGAKVEKVYLNQWFINVERYAEVLYNDLKCMSKWNPVVIKLQRNWLGMPIGCRLDLSLVHGDGSPAGLDKLMLHIKKPETIGAAAFVAVPSGHFLDSAELVAESCGSDKLLRVKAENPFTNKLLPVYVSDNIDYGFNCDVHLGVPVVRESDADFANRMMISHTSDIRADLNPAIFPKDIEQVSDDDELRGLVQEVARRRGIGGYHVSKWLKDWLISRQRYWGTPIPVVHCPGCGAVPVSYEDLPVVLPELPSEHLLNTGVESPLVNAAADWLCVPCPQCGREARRETDTMDTFVDSSWYYLRYLDPHNDAELVGRDKAAAHLPVDYYIGGVEHATAHLYYARLIHKFLCDEGVVTCAEPFHTLITQGQVKALSYRVASSGRYVSARDVDMSQCGPATGDMKGAVERNTREPVIVKWEKMSKSKLNGVDPRDIISEHGTDLTRLFVLADVPGKTDRKWDESSFLYISTLTQRLYDMVLTYGRLKAAAAAEGNTSPSAEEGKGSGDHSVDEEIKQERNVFLTEFTLYLSDRLQFNACVWRILAMTKFLKKQDTRVYVSSPQFERTLAALIVTLAPFAPHLAAELWSVMTSAPDKLTSDFAWSERIFSQQWPVLDEDCKCKLIPVVDDRALEPVAVSESRIEELSGDTEQALMTALVRERNANRLRTLRDQNQIVKMTGKRNSPDTLILYIETSANIDGKKKGKTRARDVRQQGTA